LYLERLGIFNALGDLDGKANTLWSIAQIEIELSKFHEALVHLSESYTILLKLERLEGICFVGLDFGTMLCRAGQHKSGLAILKRSHDGFVKLGRNQMIQRTQTIIDHFTKTT
jgi:hypothetical protein